MRSGEFLPVNLNQASSNIPRVSFIHNAIKSFPLSTLWTQFVALSSATSAQKNRNFPVCAFKILAKVKIVLDHMSNSDSPQLKPAVFHRVAPWKKKKGSLVFLPLVCREARCSTHGSLESTSSDLLMKNSLVCASSSSSGW